MGIRARGVAAAIACALIAGCTSTPFGFTPSLVPTGQPGAAGPCGFARHDLGNPAKPTLAVSVFEPTGDGRPFTGGTCGDSSRPVVAFIHGWLAYLPEIHQGFIEHLTSQGFVVVFADYDFNNVVTDPEGSYAVADAGVVAGVASSRGDPTRVGIIGHSLGGGMAPWMVQQTAARGWGSTALWVVLFAPHYAFLLPDGPIEVPSHTRALVVAYEHDAWIDARIGIEIFHSLTLDADHKQHLMVMTDLAGSPPRAGSHLGPVSFEALPYPIDELTTDDEDRWAAFRPVDAIARCALDGTWCDADLADMGTWPDGRPARPGISTDQPVDRGDPALQECEFPLNPRPCVAVEAGGGEPPG
ncbi:MAG TPA: hypothetical protein VJM33_00965 [Microthrixaceae bacterium]|nr:hypothetical protein [Microthrixaceae bacterium]